MLQGVTGLTNTQRKNIYAELSPMECFKADYDTFSSVKGVGDYTAKICVNQFKRYGYN